MNLSEVPFEAPKELEKDKIKEETAKLIEEMDDLQNLLYAGKEHAVLVVLQGMDASGKDGVIRKVFGHLNPQGVEVKSFKVPTEEERSHDFLWRVHQVAPARGMIRLFNRSHYEEVLTTRVHGQCDDATARKRFQAINSFEELLQKHNQTIILKFYLHISSGEQQKRLKERMEDPTKQWKYQPDDWNEASLWERYLKMYEEVIVHCNLPPWVVVPADQNWYKEYRIAQKFVETLKGLNMKYPERKEN